MEKADRTIFLLPAVDPNLTTGPILNILEQWIALVFRSLQHVDMKGNLNLQSQKYFTRDDLEAGIMSANLLRKGLRLVHGLHHPSLSNIHRTP